MKDKEITESWIQSTDDLSSLEKAYKTLKNTCTHLTKPPLILNSTPKCEKKSTVSSTL